VGGPTWRLRFAVDGPTEPACEACSGPRDEVDAAVRWLIARHDEGLAWSDMALVVPGKRKWYPVVATTLDALDVPHRMLIGHPGARPDCSYDVIHAVSLFTARGFSLAAVAIVGLGDFPWKQQTQEEAFTATLAAIGTATRFLRVSWSTESPLVSAVVEAVPTSP